MSRRVRPRVLLAITFYNGRAFYERTLESAAQLRSDACDIDVLVLDDASPDPGFSELLGQACAARGFDYYCTPRNLGIPRNVNLALLRGVDQDYDGVVISNSDVIYAPDVVSRLWQCADSDAAIGSVTAWSNNVSLYSLPNSDPDRHLADEAVVADVGEVLGQEFGSEVVDIPAGISFSMLVTRTAMHEVGLMDPIFGRGYCEEVDWSRRSLALGFRAVLAPGAFVYHAGSGSNVDAGLLRHGETTVPENERILDLRYPEFREEVLTFWTDGPLTALWRRAQAALVRRAAWVHGWSVDVSVFDKQTGGAREARCRVYVDDAENAWAATQALGFWHSVEAEASKLPELLREQFGGPPAEVRLYEMGGPASRLATRLATAQDTLRDRRAYPELVRS